MKSAKLIAALIVLSMAAAPVLSYARPGGGSGGRGSSGGFSKGADHSGSMGSRGSRTYENNGYKPIERSTTTQQPPNTTQPAAARPTPNPAGQSQPVSQPSFLQRHPLISGLAAGFAGSWIGHMLFGADNSMAAQGESRNGEGAGEGGNSMGLLLLLMVLGAGAAYYFMKVRGAAKLATVSSVFARNSMTERDLPATVSSDDFMSPSDRKTPFIPEDELKFQQILQDIQTAWGKQDLHALKRLTTPEMLHYFSTELSQHTSQDIENRVEDIHVLNAEIRETWTEGSTDYATVFLHWKARDYTVSLSKQPGEAGYVVDGDDRTPKEMSEAWTFLRYRENRWLLSAIQQVR